MDWLGKVTGSHVTIFKGDTRVMTTIVRDGKRVIGTRLESKDIVKAVLERGETVYAHNSILGVPYNSAYWPVKAADGKTVGMWSVGMPIDVLRSLEKTAIQKAIMVGCALLVLQLAISVVLGRMVGAPVAQITRYAQDVAEGKGDLHLDVHSRDDMACWPIRCAAWRQICANWWLRPLRRLRRPAGKEQRPSRPWPRPARLKPGPKAPSARA